MLLVRWTDRSLRTEEMILVCFYSTAALYSTLGGWITGSTVVYTDSSTATRDGECRLHSYKFLTALANGEKVWMTMVMTMMDEETLDTPPGLRQKRRRRDKAVMPVASGFLPTTRVPRRTVRVCVCD